MKQGWPSMMDRHLKERLVGATILVVLIVLIVPELLSGPKRPPAAAVDPGSGAAEPMRNVTVDLATSKATPVLQSAPPAASAPEPTATESASASAEDADATPAAPSSSPRGDSPSITTLRAQQPASAVASAPMVEKEAPVPTSSAVRAGTSRENAVSDSGHHGWSVQIGSFASRANAEKQARHLQPHEGAVSVSSAGRGAELRYRVRLGPFADRATAERVLAKLKKEGQPASLIAP